MDANTTRTTVAQEIYLTIRAELMSGASAAGERLKLDPLASRLQVSRTVAREALMRLVGEGLVDFNPQKGFAVVSLSPDEMADVTRARLVIEAGALRESIRHGDLNWESQVLAAHHTLAHTPAMNEDGGPNPDWGVAHDRFHASLLAGSNSKQLQDTAQRLRERVELFPDWQRTSGTDPERDIPAEHAEIMRLTIARDEDAATEALRAHIMRTMTWLLLQSEQADR